MKITIFIFLTALAFTHGSIAAVNSPFQTRSRAHQESRRSLTRTQLETTRATLLSGSQGLTCRVFFEHSRLAFRDWFQQNAEKDFVEVDILGTKLRVPKGGADNFIINSNVPENKAVVKAAQFINARGNIFYYLPHIPDYDHHHFRVVDVPAYDGIEVSPDGEFVSRVQVKGSDKSPKSITLAFERAQTFSSIQNWRIFFSQSKIGSRIQDYIFNFFNMGFFDNEINGTKSTSNARRRPKSNADLNRKLLIFIYKHNRNPVFLSSQVLQRIQQMNLGSSTPTVEVVVANRDGVFVDSDTNPDSL